MTTLIQDVRYALRQLRKTPGFTFTVLLTLALGLGANAAIFTLVNSMLLQNLSVADPQTLVRLGDDNDCCVSGGTRDDGKYSLFPTETYEHFKKNLPEFEELAAMQAGFSGRPITVRRDREQKDARSAMGEFVSGNYFRTFGLQPRAGRLLTDSDDLKGVHMTAVMSYQAWQRDYAGDASVIGSTFWVNTKPVTVVGIAPEGFYGDRMSATPPDFYFPVEEMPILANAPYVHDPETRWLYIVGRVKPGIAMGSLQEKVNTLLQQAFASRYSYSSEQGKILLAKVHSVLTPGGLGIQVMQERYSSHLHLLMWVAGLVLLIACANIANLLLVRGMGRRAELCMRTALGAKRTSIVRQLLTESVLVALMGGVAGLVVAYAGATMLLKLAFSDTQNVPIHASPSVMVIGFAFGLSLVTGVLFGVAPAWIAAQTQPVDALRSGTRTTGAGTSFLQRSLVVLQAALSLVLLVGAGLFSQSLNRLQGTDLKLDAKNRYIVHINPQAAGYSQTQLEALYRIMEARFHALPGILKVGISLYTPMEDNNWSEVVRVQGQPNLAADASWIRANADYFDSVGTHVVMGRGIAPTDISGSPTVAVVNREFVRKFFNGENPIGRRFGSRGPDSTADFEIVGVVEDTSYTSVRWKDHRMYFLPMMQHPAHWNPVEQDESLYAGTIVLQSDRPMNNIEALTRQTLSSINPNLTVVKFQTFEQQIADRFQDERIIARLTTLFGALALLLAAIGLYGVTAYTVARRTPEIGLRMAVGAKRFGVVTMVMRGAIIQTLWGLAIGIPVALVCVRFVKAQLYEITSADLNIMLGAIATVTVAGCVAGMIPARRAASIDPVQALRSE
ncbi:MAG TPA: ABC transporter permease [Terriglobales bacterium]|nr:ABC transporter permease [Terriglobales bacterium]